MIRQLNINNYETYFVLGNNVGEKSQKRRVILNISLRFLDNIPAVENDELNSTLCYSFLLNFIEKHLANASFNLIERAAQYIYNIISEYLKNNKISIRVEVIKPRPSTKNLESSSFICSDW